MIYYTRMVYSIFENFDNLIIYYNNKLIPLYIIMSKNIYIYIDRWMVVGSVFSESSWWGK